MKRKKTAQFIENILTRVTLPGACFLGFIALMPYFLQQLVGLDYSYASFFGGTSLLIIVGVTIAICGTSIIAKILAFTQNWIFVSNFE